MQIMLNKHAKNLFYAGILVTIGFFAAHVNLVQAHVLQTDGSIGAVLHIDPDDDPIIGQPATFFFDFTDKQRKFDPAKCNCNIDILDSQQKVLVKSALFQTSTQTGFSYPLFSYIFSQKGVYTIEATGQPQNPGDFQSFDLKYPIRVTRTQNPPAAAAASQTSAEFFNNHWFHLGLFVLGFIVIWLWSFAEKFQNKKKNKKPQNNSSIHLKSIAFLALFSFGMHAALLCHMPNLSDYLSSHNTGSASSTASGFASIQLPCCTVTPSIVQSFVSVSLPQMLAEYLPNKILVFSSKSPEKLISNRSPPVSRYSV
jgi:hypothetical protein